MAASKPNENFSRRDDVGIFFNSAERHGGQHFVNSRARQAAWFANLLRDAGGRGNNDVHGHVRGGGNSGGNRSRLSHVLGNFYCVVGGGPHCGE